MKKSNKEYFIANPTLGIVVAKMCEIAEVNFNKVDFTQPDWFMKYCWPEFIEDSFKTWLISYLKSSMKIRRALMNNPHNTTKVNLQKYADEFCWQYGWRLV